MASGRMSFPGYQRKNPFDECGSIPAWDCWRSVGLGSTLLTLSNSVSARRFAAEHDEQARRRVPGRPFHLCSREFTRSFRIGHSGLASQNGLVRMEMP